MKESKGETKNATLEDSLVIVKDPKGRVYVFNKYNSEVSNYKVVYLFNFNLSVKRRRKKERERGRVREIDNDRESQADRETE